MISIPLRRAAVVAALALAPAAVAAQAHAGHELPMPAVAPDAPPPLFDSLGTYSKRISTRIDTAQRYFDQGVRLLYGFNHMEAMLAFREAARRDTACAICWWGVAQSYGPDINQEMNPERWDSASAAIQRAWNKPSSGWERDYITAAHVRFVPMPRNWDDPVEVRGVRLKEDSAYARVMKEVTLRHPGDPDAFTWYAEALLDLSPWNQWSHDGSQPLAGTLAADSALQSAMLIDSLHPGANHFYIHAVEASDHPGAATTSANRLAALMPGASHMVHMPSHIYLRTGRFAEAAQANVDAVRRDTSYLRKRQALGRYPRYFAHNLEFLWAGAGMSAQHALSWRAANDQANQWPDTAAAHYPNTQHFLTTPLVVAIRFRDWHAVLSSTPPPDSLRFASGVSHYARGFAALRMRDSVGARAELARLRSIIAISGPDSVPAQSINSGREMLRLASATLAGEILAWQGNAVAIDSLWKAASIQDGLRYDEPPPFYFPVRHSLGRVLLLFNRAAEAECVYLDDLKMPLPPSCGSMRLPPTPHPNPGNLWSYKGLEISYRRQGRTADADRALGWFQTAAANSDIKNDIDASEF